MILSLEGAVIIFLFLFSLLSLCYIYSVKKFKKDAERRSNLVPGFNMTNIKPTGYKKPIRCRLGLHTLGEYKTIREGETFYDTVRTKSCERCGAKFIQAEHSAVTVPIEMKEDGY